ncbi:Werner syndrome ATP-dependent helicase homolog [Limulus polyphemus]|uniref:3'-5' exonuclease n=1 Tax=Limulus polyphemus TaxID=6850 RepID=A0ABM1BW14_LIMPO|nr:Werner syndrome ATP-dependent helicase homolog [Limulus polyphemus]
MAEKKVESSRKRSMPKWLVSLDNAQCFEYNCSGKSVPTVLRDVNYRNKPNVPSFSSSGEAGQELVSLEKVLSDDFPVLNFNGKIYCYTNIGDASRICEDLIAESEKRGTVVVGFDVEWSVDYQVGRQNKISLIQICSSENDCHLFHLASMTGFPKALRLLLEKSNIIKVGLNIEGDLWKIERDFKFPVHKIIKSSCIELSELACEVLDKPGQKWSLEGLTQFVLQRRLPKDSNVRKSCWHIWPLSQEHIQYAARDAFASFLLYKKLCEMK